MNIHPDLVPLELNVEAASAYKAVVDLCKEKFEDISESKDNMTVEAVDVTKLMRFKDDVSIRVTALGSSTCKIDMRSASRVGKSDLGKNAARIEEFFVLLRTKISG